jgi:hypothetical protein
LNGFNRIELQLKPGTRLHVLCLVLWVAAELAVWLMLPDVGLRLLSMLALLVVMPLLCWPLLHPNADDAVAGLAWEPDLGDMQLLTRSGDWCQVERIPFSCSVPGLIQVLKLQRVDRARPTWLLITPEQISRTDVRRLHVVLRWASPLASRQATGS